MSRNKATIRVEIDREMDLELKRWAEDEQGR